MTQEESKTMTAQDAWIAMALGKCVKCHELVRRIKSGNEILQVWSDSDKMWGASSTLGQQPYSIVPDPSKPKDEYEKDRKAIKYNNYPFTSNTLSIDVVFDFIEKYYQRKETK